MSILFACLQSLIMKILGYYQESVPLYFYYWCTNAKEGKDNGIKIATVDQNWKEALRKSYNRLKKSQV